MVRVAGGDTAGIDRVMGGEDSPSSSEDNDDDDENENAGEGMETGE